MPSFLRSIPFIKLMTTIPAIAAVVISIISIISTLNKPDYEDLILSWDPRPIEDPFLAVDVERFNKQVEKLSTIIADGIPEGAAWELEKSNLKSSIDDLSKRMWKLESILMTSPEKALAVPLLRRDISALKIETSLAKAEVERMYTQTLWFAGSMLAVAVTILGFVISSYRKDKE